jgi:hypothetical protein
MKYFQGIEHTYVVNWISTNNQFEMEATSIMNSGNAENSFQIFIWIINETKYLVQSKI